MTRPPYPASHWLTVANAYRTGGHKSNKAIEEKFDVNASTAASWVKHARRLGYLPPTTPGRSSNRDSIGFTRLKRVADACGIDAEILRLAIREHADGSLRIR